MATTPKTIQVTETTELPALLDDAAHVPLILERDGQRFRLSRESADDLWANYDPERVRTGVRQFAGTISVEEGERLKALIYRGREDGAQPPERP